MSWRFRQSFKVMPGLRLNLSGRGLSASIGGSPFTLNVGPRGVYGTTSIPATGISLRKRLAGESRLPPESEPYTRQNPDSVATPLSSSFPPQQIHSASTERLTSEGLKDLKAVIQTAYQEHEDISRQLSRAKDESDHASARYKSWENGFLLKHIFRGSFSVRKAQAQIASERRCELEEQLRLTTLATQIEIGAEQAEAFFRMRDAFAAVSECAAIWDIKSERATDKARERTNVNLAVTRERVKFSLQSCDLIQWEQEVPHLQNAHGGDIFLYPGFILYRAAKEAFSVIDFHDVKVTSARAQFNETESIPSDSEAIGQTWAKVNKDGSRDRRFAENYQIPIVCYGQLTFRSETGLWEVFLISNPERLLSFDKSWEDFITSFGRQHSCETIVTREPDL